MCFSVGCWHTLQFKMLVFGSAHRVTKWRDLGSSSKYSNENINDFKCCWWEDFWRASNTTHALIRSTREIVFINWSCLFHQFYYTTPSLSLSLSLSLALSQFSGHLSHTTHESQRFSISVMRRGRGGGRRWRRVGAVDCRPAIVTRTRDSDRFPWIKLVASQF